MHYANESAPTPGSHIDSDTLFHDEEERSIREQQRKTYRRNYPQIVFGYWKIKTWCVVSPTIDTVDTNFITQGTFRRTHWAWTTILPHLLSKCLSVAWMMRTRIQMK